MKRAWLLMIGSTFACGQGPELELLIEADGGVDSVQLSGVFDDMTQLPVRELALDGPSIAVRLLLPERLVGHALSLEAVGSQAGQARARGTTVVQVQSEPFADTLRLVARCGDGFRRSVEGCEDNNVDDGDGCSSLCVVEPGWTCTGTISVCTVVAQACGDGQLDLGEGCDDENQLANDGCSTACQVEGGWMCNGQPSACTMIVAPRCGDGRLDLGEGCDDGDADDGDGCSAGCQVEMGWTCAGQPSACTMLPAGCGDGLIGSGETCDDSNQSGNDGCSAVCAIEPGWMCSGAPSVCVEVPATCPNGVLEFPESCDDDNAINGDGCSSVCTEEDGWLCYGATTSTCTAPGTAVLVDGTGPRCPFGGGTGERADPFCTVTEAATNFSIGTIIVVEGVYEDKINLDGPYDLEIIGDGNVVMASRMAPVIKAKNGAQVRLRNLKITGQGGTGGGLKVETAGSRLEVEQCFVGPSAVLGIEVKDGEFSLSRSYVIGNHDGGIKLEGGELHRLSNSVIAQNGFDNSDTGGIYVVSTSGNSVAVNLTIADNEAKMMETGGIRCSAAMTVVNTIVWNNLGGDTRGMDQMCGAPSYSLLTEDFPGVGNLFGDPQFLDALYHVDPLGTGPGINAGELASAPPNDIDGDLRPLGAGVDIGADEAR